MLYYLGKVHTQCERAYPLVYIRHMLVCIVLHWETSIYQYTLAYIASTWKYFGIFCAVLASFKIFKSQILVTHFNVLSRVSHWNKSSVFTLLTFTTFVPRPKKVKKFFQNFQTLS